MARQVVSADGTRWRVGRRWLPRRPRWRGTKDPENGLDLLDAGTLLDDLPVIGDALAVVAVVVAIVGLVVLAVTFVFPAVILLIEIIVLALIAGLGVAARVVLRRPWAVEAVNTVTGEQHAWNVVGWRASGGVVDRVAAALTRGESPQTAAGL